MTNNKVSATKWNAIDGILLTFAPHTKKEFADAHTKLDLKYNTPVAMDGEMGDFFEDSTRTTLKPTVVDILTRKIASLLKTLATNTKDTSKPKIETLVKGHMLLQARLYEHEGSAIPLTSVAEFMAALNDAERQKKHWLVAQLVIDKLHFKEDFDATDFDQISLLDSGQQPPPTQDTEISNTTIRTLRHGFWFREMELFPLCNHERLPIFKDAKVRRDVQESIRDVHAHNVKIISGRNVDQFQRNFQANVGGGTQVDLAPVAKAEFRAMVHQSRASGDFHKKVISQTRLQVSQKFCSLITKPFKDDTEAKEFLEEDVYNDLVAINSKEKAESFLEKYGLFYIRQAHLGGLRIYESDDLESTQDDSKTNGIGLKTSKRAKIKGFGTKLGFEGSGSKRKSQASLNQRATAGGKTIGGDAKIMSSEEPGAARDWMKSISEDNLEICQTNFFCLHHLLPKHEGSLPTDPPKNSSPANLSLPEIRVYLYYAYMKITVGMENKERKININNGARYQIENELYTEQCFKVDVCDCDALRKGTISGTGMLVALKLADAKFFGRRKRWQMFEKISEVSCDATHYKNLWYLKEVVNRQKPRNSFLILSANGKKMLGVRSPKAQNCKATFKYIFRKYSDGLENINTNFLWNFKPVNSDGSKPAEIDSLAAVNAESERLWRKIELTRNDETPEWNKKEQR